MSVNYPTPPTVPLPLRPLNRTRRRSSSLSAIYTSSPELDHPTLVPDLHPHPHSHSHRKHPKRSRVTRNPPSPLKHSRPSPPAVAPPESEPEWTVPSGLAPLAAAAPPPPSFTSSAFDFALPASASDPTTTRLPRNRTVSSPSAATTTAAAAAYEPSCFADSSFSSLASSSSSTSTSLPPSPPSAATSPPSPPTFGFLSSVVHHHHRTSSPDGMNCDDDDDGQVEEAERLYHVAFEQLRTATRRDEEGFVDRMRRWEEAERARIVDQPALAYDDDELDDEADEDVGHGDADDELELDLEFKVEVDGFAPAAPVPLPLPLPLPLRRSRVAEVELDDLAARMQAGACELEDFALVREVQAAARRAAP
ncbi:hypothetical protein JCM11491_005932 [Sporobolomyces phaffii]